jgi:hypothetical protein
MESKTTRHKIIKTSNTKSVKPDEKLVLKPETVVEVKSTKSKKQTTNDVVELKQETQLQATKAQPVQAQTTKSTKSTKSTKAQVAPVAPVAPVAQVAPVAPVAQVAGKAVKPAKETKTTKTTKDTKDTKATKVAKAVKAVETKKVVEPARQRKVTKTEKKDTKMVTENDDNEETEGSGKLRYFKLYYNNDICGRYCGKKPKQAANKAFSSIIKEMKKTDKKEGTNVDISFSIRECTRNSSHKEYNYVGKRLVLSNPVKVQIENEDGSTKEIVYKFHNELKKAPKVPKV